MEQNKRLKDLKESLLVNLGEMKLIRGRTEGVRWEACSLVKHRTKVFNIGESKIPDRKMFTNVPSEAVRTAVNGIMGYLISQNIRWFNMTVKTKDNTPSDDVYGANDYIEITVSTILNTFNQNGFYPSTHLATMDSFVQGTSAEFIKDDIDNERINYDTINPEEFYISEDEYRNVNTFYRVYEIPIKIAYQRWGDDLPKEVLRMVRNGAGHQIIKFLHAIYPREDATKKGEAIISTEKEYASIHYSFVGDEVFKESGFDEFPIAVHRWSLNGTSPYGSCPVIELIDEIKKLDKMALQYSTAIDKYVDPPVFAPEIMKGRLNLNPGARNYANIAQVGAPQLFPTTLDLNHLATEIQNQSRVLQQALYSDLFNILMRQDQQRTATEVREIKGEGLVLLSSIIGNMQEEKITPLVLRTFNILLKGGVLPPLPVELKKKSVNGEVRVELDGPLAQNMKAYHQTTGITQGMQAMAAVMQLNPDSQVNVDFDELMRQAISGNGMPQKIIREKAEVKKIKQKQQEMLQQQAELQQQQMQADAINKMGSTQGTTPQQMAQGQVGRQ